MLNRIRERVGTAGLAVAVVALIAAIGGTAIAASGGLTAKQKTQVKAIAKGLVGTGPAGPAGTNGTNGLAGAKGDQGIQGIQGIQGNQGNAGADGKTVRSGTTAPEGSVTGNAGDFYIRTSTNQIFGPKTGADGTNTGWGSGTDLQGAPGNDGAPGADGSPWVAGTAPGGVTMKGTWSIHANAAAADEVIPLAISTAVPVNGGVIGGYIPTAAQNDPNQPFGCTGSAISPTSVNPGVVCVYEDASTNLTPWSGFASFGIDAAINSAGGGNVFPIKATAAGVVDGYGTWALVTP